MRHTTRTAGHAGFTTIELMIVVIIIGLIAAASMPSIANNVARDRVRRAQNVVAADVERAFQYAARVRKPVTITLDASSKGLYAKDRISGTTYWARDLSRSGTWALTDASITPSVGITIFPTGVSSAPLVITLSNNAFVKTVKATVAGQVTKP